MKNFEQIADEVNRVIQLMQKDWPNAVDYNVEKDDVVNIVDTQDNVIATISSERLTQYWNEMENVR